MQMRRRKDNTGQEAFVKMITLIIAVGCIILGFFLFVIIFIGRMLYDMIRRETVVSKITKTNFQDIDRLNIFYKSMYDDIFPKEVRERGEQLAAEGRIRQFEENANRYTGEIEGTEAYHAEILFDENNRILSSSCSCSDSDEPIQVCEHVYALLYKAKCRENKSKLITEIHARVEDIDAVLQRMKEYVKANASDFTYDVTAEVDRYIKRYHARVLEIKEGCSENQSEAKLLEDLTRIAGVLREIKEKIRSTLKREGETRRTVSRGRKNGLGLLTIIAAIAAPSQQKSKPEESYDKELENKMEAYNLEEWQKELVRKGNYDPSDFDDEDLDEDSYYYDK